MAEQWDADAGRKIGENLRTLLAQSRFKNQNELANHLGVPPAKISDLLRGRYKGPRVDFLAAVAAAMMVRLDDVLDGVAGFSRDLTSHADGTQSAASRPGGLADAQARVRELEAAIREEETALARIREFAIQLGDLAARRAESLAALRAVADQSRPRGGTG